MFTKQVVKDHGFAHTVHTAWNLRFPQRGQILSCADNREGQQAKGGGDRPLSPHEMDSRWGAVAVVRGGRYLYGCICKTHSLPIMLVSISMCVFSMILK